MGAVATGLGVGGALINGITGSNAATNSAWIARQNATLAASNANTALDQGDVAAQRQYQAGSQKLGAQRAQMAANGVSLNSGSALDVQNSTAQTTGQNVADSQYNALVNATNFRNQVAQDNNEERSDRAQAQNALISSGLGAVRSLAGSTSQFATKWNDMFDDNEDDDTSSLSGTDITGW